MKLALYLGLLCACVVYCASYGAVEVVTSEAAKESSVSNMLHGVDPRQKRERERPCLCTIHQGLYPSIAQTTAYDCEKRNGKMANAPPPTKKPRIGVKVEDHEEVDCDDSDASVSVHESDSSCSGNSSDASIQVDERGNSSDDSVQVSDDESNDDDEVNRGSSGDDSDIEVDSDCSSDSEVESTNTTAYAELRVKQFARELVELTRGGGSIAAADLERLLKIFHSLVEDLFGTGVNKDLPVDIPKTLYKVYQYADVEDMESVMLDICPNNDHYVFPGDASSHIHLPGMYMLLLL